MTKKSFLGFAFLVFASAGIFAQTKPFSVGARFGLAFYGYEPGKDLKNLAAGSSFVLEGDIAVIALQSAYNFTPMLGVQVEGIYNRENISVAENTFYFATVDASSLLIPVLFKVGTVIGPEIQIGGLAGPYFTVPLGDGEILLADNHTGYTGKWTGSMGLMFGGFAGKKIGPGTLFADLRYGFDFSATKFDWDNTEFEAFKKSALQISVGYSYAF